jgi:hypothetical protein
MNVWESEISCYEWCDRVRSLATNDVREWDLSLPTMWESEISRYQRCERESKISRYQRCEREWDLSLPTMWERVRSLATNVPTMCERKRVRSLATNVSTMCERERELDLSLPTMWESVISSLNSYTNKAIGLNFKIQVKYNLIKNVTWS